MTFFLSIKLNSIRLFIARFKFYLSVRATFFVWPIPVSHFQSVILQKTGKQSQNSLAFKSLGFLSRFSNFKMSNEENDRKRSNEGENGTKNGQNGDAAKKAKLVRVHCQGLTS